MIDPKIETLLQVYEKGSYVKAAETLHITQPAISHQIKVLEEELGVKLFERVDGRLVLTGQGEQVMKFARKTQSLYRNLLQDLSDSQTSARHLTVGVTHTAESNSIAEALAKYGAAHKNIN
ncbi:MAG: LysR family transcriptional regulator, partial [Clostridia bacterium]|nr:LysR family transcriptional regulator [Clostridia bacterium]